jgi:hypothetical protein
LRSSPGDRLARCHIALPSAVTGVRIRTEPDGSAKAGGFSPVAGCIGLGLECKTGPVSARPIR